MSRIFVFGSNLAGRHGAGSALYALENKGAIYGIGVGHKGMSYALPTKGFHLEILPISQIQIYVDQFIDYAKSKSRLEFEVTRIGCGLAGYKDIDIAPLFINYPSNCYLHDNWINILKDYK